MGVRAGEAALDIVTPDIEITGGLENPGVWIRPVTVLSLKVAPAREHTLITVLQPRSKQSPALGKVGVQQNNQQLVVSFEDTRVTFDRGTDGWRINNVRLLK